MLACVAHQLLLAYTEHQLLFWLIYLVYRFGDSDLPLDDIAAVLLLVSYELHIYLCNEILFCVSKWEYMWTATADSR